jgi:hypothetical protein
MADLGKCRKCGTDLGLEDCWKCEGKGKRWLLFNCSVCEGKGQLVNCPNKYAHILHWSSVQRQARLKKIKIQLLTQTPAYLSASESNPRDYLLSPAVWHWDQRRKELIRQMQSPPPLPVHTPFWRK